MFLAGKNRYTAQQSNFSKIPGSPVAYWVSDLSFQCFAAGLLSSYAETKQGFKTGDRHLWPCLRNMVGKIDDIFILLRHALWPPICSFLSLAVAPSSKFIPFKMAFFPYLFLIVSITSCIFRSRSSSACSCFRRASTAA